MIDITQALPRSEPEEQHISSAGILSFLDGLQEQGIELHSLMVLRHGTVVAEGWWQPYQPDGIHLLYSLSKSFTATAAGFAIAEGLLSLDDKVLAFFPDQAPAAPSDFQRRLELRHLLSMATGHREDTLERAITVDPEDWVRGFLSIQPEEEPGSIFAYNNGATFMVSAIVQQVTGQRVLNYLRPRLLHPLGITDAYWQQDPQGRNIGYSGLHLSTESIARFGQLFLQGGQWQGEQLLPEGWAELASTIHVANDQEENPDWSQGYGFQFWRGRHGTYRGDGAYGQFSVVMPEQDAVLATTSATENMQAILDLAWTRLLPAMHDSAPAAQPGAAAELAERLANLAIAPVDAADDAAASASTATVWLPSPSQQPVNAPPIERVTVEAVDDEFQLTLALDGADYELRCRPGCWTENKTGLIPMLGDAAEASGGWTGADTFTAEIAFTRTPHRLQVTCRTGETGGVFELGWNAIPLGSVR
ncbi:hypothetical protein GCM10009841_06490 [Microlunatus panaciterrae]|uniref:CubicO group peptidase (Beta-lactamase class C family) n=1 Tax=Microlunatus panaciterrae TaxID=400768 RepID=A0ABS2RJN2_9ACTN|nr:serine hydrolase [Microlunatus panaciterrae]MBM7798697.1 CubicO group peptidase (beta-lactamase class C family) [Microlunatus panaciterrae]